MSSDSRIEESQIDAQGYALIIGLLEERVRYDIKVTKDSLSTEQRKSQELGAQPDGMTVGMKRLFNNATVRNLSLEVEQKELWLSRWRDSVNAANLSVSKQRNTPINELIINYQRDPSRRMKLYLILQEAVLPKPYSDIDGTKYKVSETDGHKGANYIASLCGFTNATGTKILNDIDKFIRDIGSSHERLIKYVLAGALFSAITVGFASPQIGAAVGGAVFGLHGAAATMAGLALLGGGAVAAHGLGIAGGISVLVGGGALLGAASGAGISKVAQLVESNPEIVTESMAKILNYFNFLSGPENKNYPHARIIRDRVIMEFLDFKHRFEREVMISQRENPHAELKGIRVLGHVYERLLQTRVIT